MNTFTIIYLGGVVTAFALMILLQIGKKTIYLNQIIEILVNSAASWVFVAGLLIKSVISIFYPYDITVFKFKK